MNKIGRYIETGIIFALAGMGLYFGLSGLLTGEIYFPGLHGTTLISSAESPGWYYTTLVLWTGITGLLAHSGVQRYKKTAKKS